MLGKYNPHYVCIRFLIGHCSWIRGVIVYVEMHNPLSRRVTLASVLTLNAISLGASGISYSGEINPCIKNVTTGLSARPMTRFQFFWWLSNSARPRSLYDRVWEIFNFIFFVYAIVIAIIISAITQLLKDFLFIFNLRQHSWI